MVMIFTLMINQSNIRMIRPKDVTMIIVNNLAAYELHNGNIYVKSDMLGMSIAYGLSKTFNLIVIIGCQ